ncbi:MAG: 2-dehydro-3-deoxygalactonokinase, partial [Tistlia sp.]
RTWPCHMGHISRGGPGRGARAGRLAEAFEAALVGALADWLDGLEAPLPVLVCGMAGARQGWREAPYLDLPLALGRLGEGLLPVETRDPRLAVALVPGLAQRDPAAPDVLRGEETQILGFLAGRPADERGGRWTLCLPGTHAKWVEVAEGRLLSFRTYMTGELFALLADHSILRHSLGDGSERDPAAFAVAVQEALEQPAEVPARLFALRARHLLFEVAGGAARSRLSGLLIGQELASAVGAGEAGKEASRVAVIGDDALAALYAEALVLAGRAPETASGAATVIQGLAAIRRQGR